MHGRGHPILGIFPNRLIEGSNLFNLWASVYCNDYRKDIQEVIHDMKTDGLTSIGQLIETLDFYGIKHVERNVHMNAGYTHWVLFHHGKYYDPEFGLLEIK